MVSRQALWMRKQVRSPKRRCCRCGKKREYLKRYCLKCQDKRNMRRRIRYSNRKGVLIKEGLLK